LNTTQKRRKSNSSYICSPIDYHHTITSLYIKKKRKGKRYWYSRNGDEKGREFLCLGENLGTQKDRRITNWKAISTVEENKKVRRSIDFFSSSVGPYPFKKYK